MSETPQEPTQEPAPEQKPVSKTSETQVIYNVYAVLGVSIVLSVIPSGVAAFLCAVFFLIVLAMAHAVRKKTEAHSLSENHMTYLIRSIWISSLAAILTMIGAAFYMLGRIDYASFETCAHGLSGHDPAALQAMGNVDLYQLAQPCMDDFMSANHNVFVMSMMIAGVPPLLYLVYRYAKGLNRAVKGYRLADPKGWL